MVGMAAAATVRDWKTLIICASAKEYGVTWNIIDFLVVLGSNTFKIYAFAGV